MKISRVLDEMFHVELPSDLSQPLSRFHENVLDWNAYASLVSSQTTIDDLWDHTLDSLTLAPYVKHSPHPFESHWDIGCGGGFPGLTLALAIPTQNFVLVERSRKKYVFLERQVREFGLANVTTLSDSFPDTAPSAPFSMTARAIERPSDFLKSLENVWKEESLFLSQFKDSESLFGTGWQLEGIEDVLDEFRRGNLYLARR